MALKFQTTLRGAAFLDPFSGFQPRRVTVEVRRDPLFGDTSRILPFRRRDLGSVDHAVFLKRDRPDKCPFCPERLERYAARFLPDLVPEGHLALGQAVCFPNAFPYEALNAVVVMSRAHYLRPSQLTPDVLADALWLSRLAFRRLGRGLRYGSVNWNYMMPAGAGLVHPHFQVAGGRAPTRAQAAMRSRARAYARGRDGASLAADYLAAEKRAGQRYVGRSGPWHWLSAFAPRGLFDFIALAPNTESLLSMRRAGVDALSRGISRVINYLEDQGVGAFNLALHTGLVKGSGLPLVVRLVSRVDIPPMGVDEINYFHRLHDECLTFVPPEEAAADLAAGWKGKYADNT